MVKDVGELHIVSRPDNQPGRALHDSLLRQSLVLFSPSRQRAVPACAGQTWVNIVLWLILSGGCLSTLIPSSQGQVDSMESFLPRLQCSPREALKVLQTLSRKEDIKYSWRMSRCQFRHERKMWLQWMADEDE